MILSPLPLIEINKFPFAFQEWLKNVGRQVAGYIGYIPQISSSANYTFGLMDAGSHLLHPITDNNARTFTIPANTAVPFKIGTVLYCVNMINTVTIAITTDTMYWAGTGATGSRSLAAYGEARMLKIGSTSWLISGTNLT